MQPAVDDQLLGAVIGRYRIERAIAHGGMGRVYLGVQPEIGSRVAIKVLSEQCAEDPELVERFFAEARAVNMIAHENIVKVLDLSTLDDGRPFIVMEHVDGVTLTAATRGGRAPLGGIVHVFLDVLSALGAAHAIGIVHRDLKPDNIMITAKGHAKVLDFGIAKFSPQQNPNAGARTVTGALLGTPAYMAPEQIADAGNVDARADIYAAGAVLFHAVTGRPPFGGATMFDVMRAQLEEEPPSPRSFRQDLPLAIERVIMRALAKEPAVRFASVAEMASALDEAAADLPDHQWFDLSRRTAPMRARGSGKLTQPPPVQRDTPPAISAVNVPVQQRRSRAIVPLAIVAAIGVAIGVFALVRERPAPARVATPTVVAPDAAVAQVAPVVDARAPDAAVVTPPIEAAKIVIRPKKPVRSPEPPPITTMPTKAAPQVVAVELGAAARDLTYEATSDRARAIARMLPGVDTAKLLDVTVGNADASAVDVTRGAWVQYRLLLDPPPAEGCMGVVTFGKRVTVHVEKASCAPSFIVPPKCKLSAAWQLVVSQPAQTNTPEWIRYGHAFWRSSDNVTQIEDRACR